MPSKVELLPKAVRWQNQSGADPLTETIKVVTSQRTQAGDVKAVKSVGQGRNVTIVSLVVSLDM